MHQQYHLVRPANTQEKLNIRPCEKVGKTESDGSLAPLLTMQGRLLFRGGGDTDINNAVIQVIHYIHTFWHKTRILKMDRQRCWHHDVEPVYLNVMRNKPHLETTPGMWNTKCFIGAVYPALIYSMLPGLQFSDGKTITNCNLYHPHPTTSEYL